MATGFLSSMVALITTAHSREAAAEYLAYIPTMGELSKAWKAARVSISSTPERASACVPMTAALARQLLPSVRGPAFLVAGSLRATDGTFIFGGPDPMDCGHLFEISDVDWNGHPWLMLGPYVVDVSLTRSVRLDAKRTNLKALVRRQFGETDDAVIVRWDDAEAQGMQYLPQCILSERQVAHLLETVACL